MSQVPDGDHLHEWRLETPNGAAHCAGRCKICGEWRLFAASEEEATDTAARLERIWAPSDTQPAREGFNDVDAAMLDLPQEHRQWS